MELTFKELVDAINGEVLVDNSNKEFDGIAIDSRKVEKNNIYWAIKGEHFNGNDFAVNALKDGATIAIVEEVNFDIHTAENLGIIIKVPSTLQALLDLGSYYRNKLDIKIIGVTGSTGKTSTKDLVAALLSDKYKVFKTKGNYNSEIGLPLMIMQLTSEYDVAVLEMGMSHLGDIDLLAKVATPDIAVITNIGITHIENLKTQENILKAKMEIINYFNENNILIVNGEDEKLCKINKSSFKVEKIGYNHEYDVYASNIILREEETEFLAHANGEKAVFTLPMAGKHNVLNSMLAIAVAKNLGVTFEEMKSGLKNIEATSMRLQLIKKDNITIVNDCYNASPDSMKSSLDVIKTYKGFRKVAILGDMYELGTKTEEAHIEVGEYAKDKVDLLIAIGENINNYEKGFESKNIKLYKTKDECIIDLPKLINTGDIILVKASRGVKLEDIVLELEKM